MQTQEAFSFIGLLGGMVGVIGFSGVLTRNIIESLKKKGWVDTGLEINIASAVINFIIVFAISLVDAYLGGNNINLPFIQVLIATVWTSLYADYKKNSAIRAQAVTAIANPNLSTTVPVVDGSFIDKPVEPGSLK